MDFAFDQRTEQLRTELLAFMDEHVYPAEPEFERSDPGQPFSWERPKIMAELRAEARRRGLWNLFLPGPGARRRPDEPAVRPAGRDHRAQPARRPRGGELQRAGHREHGAAAPPRHARAAGAVAGAAAGGPDPLGFLHDRARRGLVRRVEHRAADDAHRRRRVRPERAQVVDDGRALGRRRGAARDGGERARRAAPRAAHDPARPEGLAGRAGQAGPVGVRFLGRDTRGARRGGVRRRPGGSRGAAGGAGTRFRAGPGTAGAGPDPPLHAADRDGRAGVRPDVPPRRGAGRVRQAAGRAGRRPGDRSPTAGSAWSSCGCRCCAARG